MQQLESSSNQQLEEAKEDEEEENLGQQDFQKVEVGYPVAQSLAKYKTVVTLYKVTEGDHSQLARVYSSDEFNRSINFSENGKSILLGNRKKEKYVILDHQTLDQMKIINTKTTSNVPKQYVNDNRQRIYLSCDDKFLIIERGNFCCTFNTSGDPVDQFDAHKIDKNWKTGSEENKSHLEAARKRRHKSKEDTKEDAFDSEIGDIRN